MNESISFVGGMRSQAAGLERLARRRGRVRLKLEATLDRNAEADTRYAWQQAELDQFDCPSRIRASPTG